MWSKAGWLEAMLYYGSFCVGQTHGHSDKLSLAPFVGLEWLATDRLSFSIVPRVELLVGSPSAVSVIVPFTMGWSFYWF